jgi:hypothetical protein
MRFIEDFFAYRLPWGISGYLQIAASCLGFPNVPVNLGTLPILVRYGVPNAPAAWAMAFGIPSRRLATRVSERYLAEVALPSSTGLRRWLNRLDPDELPALFGLPEEVTFEMTTAVMRAGGNEVLTAFYRDGTLPERIDVHISRQGRYGSTIGTLQSREVLLLARDYESYNRNSVVAVRDHEIIFKLPRDIATAISLDMDAGVDYEAEVLDVTRAPDFSRLMAGLNIRRSTQTLNDL